MRIVTSAKRASDSRAVLHRHAMLQHMRAGMLHAEAGKRLEKVNKDLSKVHKDLSGTHEKLRESHRKFSGETRPLPKAMLSAARGDARKAARILDDKTLSKTAFESTHRAHKAALDAYNVPK